MKKYFSFSRNFIINVIKVIFILHIVIFNSDPAIKDIFCYLKSALSAYRLCRNLFFNKVASLRSATSFKKRH